MILVKKLKFFRLLCLSKIDRENVMLTFWIEKKPFKTIRTSVYEKRKFRFLPKSIVFLKNVRFIQLFFYAK